MTLRSLALLTSLTIGAAGCSGVTVYPTGADVSAVARPADCAVEFLFEAPSRPYDSLGDLQSHVMTVPAGGAWLALRPKACELGADAVIVTRNQVLNYFGHVMVDGTAIKFRAAPAIAPAPAVEAPAAPPPVAAPPAAPPATPAPKPAP